MGLRQLWCNSGPKCAGLRKAMQQQQWRTRAAHAPGYAGAIQRRLMVLKPRYGHGSRRQLVQHPRPTAHALMEALDVVLFIWAVDGVIFTGKSDEHRIETQDVLEEPRNRN